MSASASEVVATPIASVAAEQEQGRKGKGKAKATTKKAPIMVPTQAATPKYVFLQLMGHSLTEFLTETSSLSTTVQRIASPNRTLKIFG
jgi:hypothetical protein